METKTTSVVRSSWLLDGGLIKLDVSPSGAGWAGIWYNGLLELPEDMLLIKWKALKSKRSDAVVSVKVKRNGGSRYTQESG